MKTKFYSLVLFFITATLSLVAQTDNRGFNFQGYAVSPDGVALSTTSITARFTIYVITSYSIHYTKLYD